MSVLYVSAKSEVDGSIRSTVIRGVPKFRNWVTLPRPRPFKGRFMVRTQKGSILYVYTKFEVDSSIRSKVIEVPKFRNWVT